MLEVALNWWERQRECVSADRARRLKRFILNKEFITCEPQTGFTFRDLFGVVVPRNLRLVGVRTAVPYSMSSSVCLLFLRCCYEFVKRSVNTFLSKHTGYTYNTTRQARLPFLVSPSLSLFGAAPTVPPHTAGTSGCWPETHDPVHSPMHQSGLSISFQAEKKQQHIHTMLSFCQMLKDCWKIFSV